MFCFWIKSLIFLGCQLHYVPSVTYETKHLSGYFMKIWYVQNSLVLPTLTQQTAIFGFFGSTNSDFK